MKNVTVAVVLYNAKKLLPELGNSIRSLPESLKVIIYDSASEDDSAEAAAKELNSASVITGPNRGFGFGNNRCLEQIETEYTLFLNSDASIDTESLGKLTEFLDTNPEYAGVQPVVRLWGWEKITASCGVYITEYGEAWDSRFMHLELSPVPEPLKVPAITAAVSLWRTDALRSVNGFDEKFFMYFEDSDLSLRLGAAGWKLAVIREARASHMVGASSNRKNARVWELESSIRMFRRYLGKRYLSKRWWKRELRICLYTLSIGKSPFWRIASILRALRGNVERIELPSEIMAMLFGDPMDYPRSRPQKDCPGPGWMGSTIAPSGGLKTSCKSISLKLKALEYSLTGAIYSGEGDVIQRFSLPPEEPVIIKLAEPPPIVYIHCDSSSDRLEVHSE